MGGGVNIELNLAVSNSISRNVYRATRGSRLKLIARSTTPASYN